MLVKGATELILLTEIKVEAKYWNPLFCFVWGVITHPCHDPISDLAKPSLKLCHGWVMASIVLYAYDYLSMPNLITGLADIG